MTPNTRTLKGQSYCSQRWANPVWPKGSKSRGFSTLLVSGKLAMAVKNYRTYNLIYQDMPAEPEWYDSQDGSLYGVLFSVKFLEPQPEV